MDIKDIKIFLEINNCRNISTAARTLFLTQSTVSRRLSMLEKELNVKLFSRGKGHDTVQLTLAGERFLIIAEQILALSIEVNSIEENKLIQHLSVAVPDSLASYMLRDFFRQLSRENPNLKLEIIVSDSNPTYEMVANREVDIGLTNGEAPYPELNSKLVFKEDFVVMRKGNKDSFSQLVHPSELKSGNEIYQFFGSDFNRWHDYWWKPGFAKLRVNLAQLTVEFLNEEEDWAILPESVASTLLPEDCYLSYIGFSSRTFLFFCNS
ncbi:LysR family transcriptional regulator [Lysinibacillus telephonicus]|uniref:LysR family transcriptional regulator n=1 Tax=Lysinibacillus telephonicus TaxID=1714840 RepID=A0A431UEV1_9BACI|nr:LysR family transcriptional regulator [Lysinibacillus telephonicus]RTQ87794.1 LysR family transcriptional regulator [Lysinibacillus telephonicus]